jgi:hypothetical protein
MVKAFFATLSDLPGKSAQLRAKCHAQKYRFSATDLRCVRIKSA